MTMSRSEEARDQEAVARHLIEVVVRRRFAGEDVDDGPGSLDGSPARSSSSAYSILVNLPSRPQAILIFLMSRGCPIQHPAPSELGVTVWVDVADGATHLRFSVEGSFSDVPARVPDVGGAAAVGVTGVCW